MQSFQPPHSVRFSEVEIGSVPAKPKILTEAKTDLITITCVLKAFWLSETE